jgi:mannitol/fructose-specific phosphotransferase system IIA component (Ntr-type)
VLSPADAPAEHLKSLAAISRWAKVDHHASRLMKLHDIDAICDLLREESA